MPSSDGYIKQEVIMKDVRVGIYVRLSNDDLREGESMSIEIRSIC